MGRFIDRSNVNSLADNYATGDIQYLYLKATQGTTFVDSTRNARRALAARAGVHIVGDYHFANLEDPVAECEHFLSVIGRPAAGAFRPCLDLERGTTVSDVGWAEAWIAHFRGKMGYLPVLYGSTSLIVGLRASSALIRACPWWRAEFGINDGHFHPLQGGTLGANAHQFTDQAHIPGIVGNTDQSVFCAPATPMIVPGRTVVTRISKKAWEQAQWWLSIGKYKGHGRVQHAASRAPGEVDPFRPVTGFSKALAWYRKHVKP